MTILWSFISLFSGFTAGLAIGLTWKPKKRRTFKPGPEPYNPVREHHPGPEFYAPDRERLPAPEPYNPER